MSRDAAAPMPIAHTLAAQQRLYEGNFRQQNKNLWLPAIYAGSK